MLVVPDPTTAVMDPFTALPTLSLICNIVDPLTKEDYSRDPRNIARKAEAYLKSTGIGDTAYFGPEPEFFVFDEVRYEQNQHTGFYLIDSAEGQWNTAREVDAVNDRSGRLIESKNLGYKPRYKEGDRKSTRLNSSHVRISYAVFCLKKKKNNASTPEVLSPTAQRISH